jgi:hypothetical protein
VDLGERSAYGRSVLARSKHGVFFDDCGELRSDLVASPTTKIALGRA